MKMDYAFEMLWKLLLEAHMVDVDLLSQRKVGMVRCEQ
jgi:hypothetical protein